MTNQSTFFVLRNGLEIDLIRKTTDINIPEHRRAKFSSLGEACNWAEKNLQPDFPSQFDDDSIRTIYSSFERMSGISLVGVKKVEEFMRNWFKADWSRDFDIVINEHPAGTRNVFNYRRTSAGWAVNTTGGWDLVKSCEL